MTTRIKVVHVPARTPYARKLANDGIEVLNEKPMEGHGVVPRDVTFEWLLDHRPLTWLDVLHLHHIEFESCELLCQVLAECARRRRRVVVTAHDVQPIFTDRLSHDAKLKTLAEWRLPFVCLTAGAERELRTRLGSDIATLIVPHGYVVPPSSRPPRQPRRQPTARYLLFGALRANRDIETVLYNWRFGRRQQMTTMLLLLRARGRANLAAERAQWQLISLLAGHEPRLKVEVSPFPTDDEIVEGSVRCDALILPYCWATHSGQLELAFDLGLLPVASRIGYLPEQVEHHAGLVHEPVWFDWADGAEYAYGERFLAALDDAAELLQTGYLNDQQEAFSHHRQEEHQRILAAYQEVYSLSWP
jgi:hypothetical protein